MREEEGKEASGMRENQGGRIEEPRTLTYFIQTLQSDVPERRHVQKLQERKKKSPLTLTYNSRLAPPTLQMRELISLVSKM